MRKPWSIVTFPKHKMIWIRAKGNVTPGANLIVSIAAPGVNVLLADKGKTSMVGVSWLELYASFQQIDGSICGENR